MAASFSQSLKVLELASVLAGPAVGLFFAELGAEVIKVENLLTAGDVTRCWRLPQESSNTDISAYFSCINWGKRSLALNLKTAEGLAIIQKLAAQADIVIVNYKPGDAEKLGVDAASLRKQNPGLIYAHLTGYGPDNSRAGFDALIQAETGFVDLNGESEGPGLKMPVALMDLLAAHQLKEAILIALLERQATGQGALLEIGLFQSGLVSLANQASAWLQAGQLPQRMGSEHPSIVPYGTVYSCQQNQKLMLAVGNDAQFKALCEVLGCPELIQNQRFQTNPLRVQNRQQLHPLLQTRIENFQRQALLTRLWQAKVPAGALHTVAEALEQPEAQALLLKAEKAGSSYLGLRSLAFAPPQGLETLLPPPHLGEHSQELLVALGLSLSEIQSLEKAGIILTQNMFE
ncbi:carnitine dehydratase [bacterium (Candidatus Blackallbacteria) CG17_big_fil_post_rev_8_21_14_2_50_48_46]|uniref:Carnitine dehydratase n=1 Tax=bacterium (Candidatus Blackallbacteria) CG17_big_fil_post_rev_8_21_14_2_50_48_46 TaxID=2014261 RepID=A0A2M7FYY3_9BACT|nr:MAG: carnitine dehydratase [bacterium (Candidatus Blackallbacteria) CG18_big_fil_WC_8_21_14_2_50_49_26]PIW14584.1 MAG: carnitine dehydratase [bacterium (Candidatus Blackallbacteria) CG17_big_fil_post_rev_8_21_14_2_50_48_46]PIW47269.1 MAG: carnitine dehydratase [bacterium (Candidatus Blackallbacteria) CG13_big_fil_rev_8_21_14_2_50_49_14]